MQSSGTDTVNLFQISEILILFISVTLYLFHTGSLKKRFKKGGGGGGGGEEEEDQNKC